MTMNCSADGAKVRLEVARSINTPGTPLGTASVGTREGATAYLQTCSLTAGDDITHLCKAPFIAVIITRVNYLLFDDFFFSFLFQLKRAAK